MSPRIAVVRGPLASAGVLAVWAFLAVRNPDLTYHFAPLLAAAAWPVLLRRDVAPPWRLAVAGASGAFVLTTSVALLLAGGGYLEGPTFWGEGPALTEAIVFALLGAAGGAAVALRPARGISTN